MHKLVTIVKYFKHFNSFYEIKFKRIRRKEQK